MDIQRMMDEESKKWEQERADTQMTLGKLVARLNEMPLHAEIDAIGEAHSYRGFYSDLAFERKDGKMKVADLLVMCKWLNGFVFQGYKGGDFKMSENTPLWIASWGNTGDRLMDIRDDGTIVTEPFEY